jgi:hypothetical protein
MNLSRHYPETFEELQSLVAKAASGARSVVMQAGHFLLMHHPVTGQIVPCIASKAKSSDFVTNAYGHFPLLTWHLGARLLASLPANVEKRLMVVVNDWQYLSESGDRADFYANYGRLPSEYTDILLEYPEIGVLEPRSIKTGVSTRPFFGEMNLRNQYRRHVEKLIKRGDLPPKARVSEKDGEITCSLPTGAVGEDREVYCSKRSADCAAQIDEMLHFARLEVACDCYINLYPAVCSAFVEYGTLLSESLLRNDLPVVLNLGFPSTEVASEEELLADCQGMLHHFPQPTH